MVAPCTSACVLSYREWIEIHKSISTGLEIRISFWILSLYPKLLFFIRIHSILAAHAGGNKQGEKNHEPTYKDLQLIEFKIWNFRHLIFNCAKHGLVGTPAKKIISTNHPK